MVERKTSDSSSKDYWASLEKLKRDVDAMPTWMKTGTPSADKDSSSGNDSKRASAARKK